MGVEKCGGKNLFCLGIAIMDLFTRFNWIRTNGKMILNIPSSVSTHTHTLPSPYNSQSMPNGMANANERQEIE